MRNITSLVLALTLLSAGAGCGSDDPTGTGGSGASHGSGGSGASGGGGGGTGGGGTGGGGTGGGGTGGGSAEGAIDPDTAARAAVFIASCGLDDHINEFLERFYVERGGEPLDLALAASPECLKDKTNGCAAVEECLGLTVTMDPACTDACNGDVLTACEGPLRLTVDCGKLGLACSLTQGGCITNPPPPACNPATFQGTCTDAPHICTLGGIEGFGPKCADLGLTCGETQFDEPVCQGTGAACQSDFADPLSASLQQGLACEGDDLRVCVNGGEHVLDCAGAITGASCQTGSAKPYCGFATDCEPGASSETCEGDNVVICNAGRVEKIDCKALGFTTCDPVQKRCDPNP